MSLAPKLTNAAVNLTALRDHARNELIKILTANGEKKVLVLDKSLSGPLSLVAEMELFKKYGVEEIFLLLEDELITDCKNIIYMVRAEMSLMPLIAEQIRSHKKDPAMADKEYSVYFVPRKTMLCEQILEDMGVKGSVRIGAFHLELIAFDEDVLSLELSSAFRETFLDGDPSSLFIVARSLMRLQSVFGLIPTVKGKGDGAAQVWELMKRMRREQAGSMGGGVVSEIDSLILIDRTVDMISPLVTQQTYEGLIDELIGIKNSYIDVDAEVLGEQGGKRKIILNSSDSLYKEIRDLHWMVLGPLLHKKAAFIQDTYQKRHDADSVPELHAFMQKFKTAHSDHNFLQTHTNVATDIGKTVKSKTFDRKLDVERSMLECTDLRAMEDYMEEQISKMQPLPQVLRLLCLLSQTNGLKPKRFDFYRNEIIQTYGYPAMFTLQNLESMGLLVKGVKRSTWPTLRKALKLSMDKTKIDFANPQDISYVFSGYAPISVRLVELAHQQGWKQFRDVLDLLPGKAFEHTQTPERKAGSPTPPPVPPGAVPSGRKPVTLVYFLGGVTFAEISALRHLSERNKHNRDYIIATTKLVNGNTLMESLFEDIPNLLDKSTVVK